jgi:hypothetical protein
VYFRKLAKLEKRLKRLKRHRNVSSDRTQRGSAEERSSKSMDRTQGGSSSNSQRNRRNGCGNSPPPTSPRVIKKLTVSGRRSPTVSITSDEDEDGSPNLPTRTDARILDKDILEIDAPLDRDFLEMLGEETSVKLTGDPLHKDIASRWAHTATNGLSAEQQKSLRIKYLVPSNCEALGAPKLNPEIGACLPPNSIKKDEYKQALQDSLGSGITALGNAMTILIHQGSKMQNEASKKCIESLADAGKILCDTQYMISTSRRACITPALNFSVKSVADNSKIDSFLYGSGLPEAIKSAKIIEKTGKDIKASRRSSHFPSHSETIGQVGDQNKASSLSRKGSSLNSQRPPRPSQTTRRSEGGQRRFHSNKTTRPQFHRRK